MPIYKEKRLSREEIKDLIKKMEAATENLKSWEEFFNKYSQRKALIEFPLGELFNPNIRGYLWAWQMAGKIQTKPITEKDRFKAQGLEGKASIPVDMVTALLVWRELPEYRRQIIELVPYKHIKE